LECFRWDNCPEQTRIQVNRLVTEFRHQFNDILVGVYLHGSLATGCFSPAMSDIDLLVVTQQRLLAKTKKQIIKVPLRISKSPHPIEISFLSLDDLHPWKYPTPFDLHYSEDWRERYEKELALGKWQHWFSDVTDNDLAAHIMVTKMRGVCLWGESIESVFPDVPHEDFADSITSDLKWVLERLEKVSVYAVLNACRIYAYFKDAFVLSKVEGAEWALENMPMQFHSVIMVALQTYRSPEQKALLDKDDTRKLLEYVKSAITATG